PPRQVTPVPSDPIDEEEDMARLFLHDRLEGLDQLGREKRRAFRDRKQPEREEAVDAFSENRHHESPFSVARLHIFAVAPEADTIGIDKARQHFLVAALLKRIELDRIP